MLPVLGVAQTRLPVFVVAEVHERDIVGQKVIDETKDAIRASQRFRLVENQRQWPYLKLLIKAERTAEGESIIAHAVLYESLSTKLSGLLATFGFDRCSATKVEYCTRNVIGDVESAVDALRRGAPELFETMK